MREAVSGAPTPRQEDDGACECSHPSAREKGRHDETNEDYAEKEEEPEVPDEMLEVQLKMQNGNGRAMIDTGAFLSLWATGDTFLQMAARILSQTNMEHG